MTEPGDTGLVSWVPRSNFEEVGVILEWDAKNIVLVRENGTAQTSIPGDTVIRIEPSWANELGNTLHTCFGNHEFEQVLAQGKKTLESGLPRWQQRIVIAEMIDAAMAIGKTQIATRLFATLAKENPPQLLMASIPIPWSDDQTLAGGMLAKIQIDAKAWRTDPSELVQLMGASWLISGNDRRLAIETLESLTKSKQPVVSAYAKAQLWRTVPPAEMLSDRYPQWISERDRCLLPVQAGPTLLLAERLQQAGQSALAVPEWLRIATLHADRYHLANKSIEHAAQALRGLGRVDEAKVIEQAFPQLWKPPQ